MSNNGGTACYINKHGISEYDMYIVLSLGTQKYMCDTSSGCFLCTSCGSFVTVIISTGSGWLLRGSAYLLTCMDKRMAT